MIKTSADTDLRDFNNAMKSAVRESSRSQGEVVNGQALALSIRAIRATKKADANAIRNELGQTGTKLRRDRKTGKLKAGAKIYASKNTLAHFLVMARLWAVNAPIPDSATIDKMAKALRAARIRSAGFIRSGWIAPINYFFKVVKGPDRRERVTYGGAKQYGKPKGGGIRSNLGFTSNSYWAEVWNSALTPKKRPPSLDGNPYKIAEAGWRIAVRETTADMVEHLRKKMEKIAKKHSA